MHPRRLIVLCGVCLGLGLVLSCSEDNGTAPDTTAPTVALTFPTAGDTLRQDTTFTAQAEDNVGVIAVTFWTDSTRAVTDSLPPYEMSWTMPGLKAQAQLRVMASGIDQAGNEGFSEEVTVTVGSAPDEEAPTVSLTSPPDGTDISNDVTITASAEDNVGVSYVTFLIDDAVVGTDSLPPYEYLWDLNPVADAGDHELTARAADAAGNVQTSDIHTVTVIVPGDINLADAIGAAPPGAHNGYDFARLVDLDPQKRYYVTGELVLRADTCIRGHSAMVDLERNGYILVYPPWLETVRVDIEYCLIVRGLRPTDEENALGGALEYLPDSEGWVKNNTFYDNSPAALYLHQISAQRDLQVKNNVFFQNVRGLIRYEDDVHLAIWYNNATASAVGPDFGKHCGCPTDPTATEIVPGTEELHGSNFSLNPQFVQEPNPPRIPGDFHLLETSPCRGAGEDNVDIGAFPYEE